jgi:tripartite ATP-independent transporter DctM subunit
MGPVAGVSVVDLFTAAVIPGIMLALLFMAYTTIRCLINPALGPALPESEQGKSLQVVLKELLVGAVPVTILILCTLGSILGGLATPTEAAAMGAAGSFFLVIGYKKLTLKSLKDSLYRTLEISSMILVLVVGSNFFGSVFSRLGSANLLTEFFLKLDLPPMIMLVALMLLVFVLGWPLEWIPIVVIIIPIILPVIIGMKIDLLWFCILMAVTMQTCWLSPPVALSAYYLKGVMPEWDLKDIYLGMMQFMWLQCLGALLILFFPSLATWLPSVW